MLVEKCEKFYTKEYDLNCAECMLYASNEEYNLGLSKDTLKLAGGFGGGMAIEGECGALTGGIMVLGYMFVKERAHESELVKNLTKEFIKRFNDKLKTTNCKELKDMYRNDETRCFAIIKASAEALDEVIKMAKSE